MLPRALGWTRIARLGIGDSGGALGSGVCWATPIASGILARGHGIRVSAGVGGRERFPGNGLRARQVDRLLTEANELYGRNYRGAGRWRELRPDLRTPRGPVGILVLDLHAGTRVPDTACHRRPQVPSLGRRAGGCIPLA